MYILLKKIPMNVHEDVYKPILKNIDIIPIYEELKRRVTHGCPLEDLSIVKNVEFEFNCNVNVKED